MQLIMAGALLLLALARVPAFRKNGRDPVFLAAAFAGVSSALAAPAVYFAVDALLGGMNVAKLAVNSFMVVGLWYLRAAVVAAVTQGAVARSTRVRHLPLTVTLVLQVAFFILTGPTTTTLTWGNDYHHLLPAALFSLMMIAFIAWSCGEIAWACMRFVPRMRSSFRVGFIMVGVGCLISICTMAMMAMDALSRAFPLLTWMSGAAAVPFHMVEVLAISLVGIGLTIPALAGRAARRRYSRVEQERFARVAPLRERVLANVGTVRVLEADADARPHERLHRMIVEIWDAELAAGDGFSALTDEERAYLLSVESDIRLERTS
ncbi:MAG: hypothetical protein JWO49_1154 [Arthrobacter sp.]|nr:hypothetical protein [Arthrobacter sp.]